MRLTYKFATRNRKRDTEGVNESCWNLTVNAVGKGKDDNPYLIANEWISANVGTFLRLPIPPFSVMQGRDAKTRMFASLSFEGATRPADVRPYALWAADPELCTRIVLFDVLIGNPDRHEKNIKVDRPAKPGRIYLFDHDLAILYRTEGEGVRWLRRMRDELIVNWHCLLPVIASAEHFRTWAHRIGLIPDWYIDSVCDEAKAWGLRKQEADEAKVFLKHRRDNLDGIITKNKHLLPNVADLGLFL